MSDTIKIQVITKEQTPYGEYCDAIYYKDMAEYEARRDDGSHGVEKSKRVANYINAVKNPGTPVEPTKEELLMYKANLEAQIAGVNDKLLTAEAKVIV